MRLIDTHLHLIDRSRLTYDWLDGVPVLKRDWSYADYAAVAHAGGVTDVLHMDVDVLPEQAAAEVDMVRGLVAGGTSRLRGAIAGCRPEGAGFADWVAQAAADPLIRGFRRVLHVVPDDLSASPLFRANLRRLAGTGLTFDLCLRADQLAIGLALVDHCPGVSFIVDHLGGAAVGPSVDPLWRRDMARLAERPNVVVKVSGIAATAKAGWTYAEVAPAMAAAVELFGCDRLLWGSDWPVCTLGGRFDAWLEATHRFADTLSTDERSGLFHRTAERIYRVA